MFGSLYTVFFVFAILGQLLYGGQLTTNSAQAYDDFTPGLYYLMNFNDFGASIVTLFHIMVVNNWYVTCNMFCVVMDATWPRVYFILFWILTVLIMLNLVISFVLEIFADVGASVSKAHKRSQFVIQLKSNFQEYVHLEEQSGYQSSNSSGDAQETPSMRRKRATSLDDDIDETQELKLTELMGQDRKQEKNTNAHITKKLAPINDDIATKRKVREIMKGIGLHADLDGLAPKKTRVKKVRGSGNSPKVTRGLNYTELSSTVNNRNTNYMN